MHKGNSSISEPLEVRYQKDETIVKIQANILVKGSCGLSCTAISLEESNESFVQFRRSDNVTRFSYIIGVYLIFSDKRKLCVTQEHCPGRN